MSAGFVLGFVLLISLNSLCLLLFTAYYLRFFHSAEQRKKKAVAVRVPEMVQLSLLVVTLHVAALAAALFNATRQSRNRIREIEYGLSLFCAEFFEAMICCLALRMDWQFSLGKLEMARVWKSELNMQVKRAWVLSLTPLLRSSRGLIATCLALSLILTAMELLTLRTVYDLWSFPMTGLVFIILECTLSVMVISMIVLARQHTGKVKDHYGVRSEMKWIIAGLVTWTVVGVCFVIVFPLGSLAWSMVHHCRNSMAIWSYFYLTLYLPCVRHLQIRRSANDNSGSSLNRTELNLPPATLALLRRVLSNYDSFVLLTEHCVSEMSVEGILFIVWYMRAKQLLFAFLRDRDMFDYDSVPDISTLKRSGINNSSIFQLNDQVKSSSPSARKSQRKRRFSNAQSKPRRRTSLTLSIPTLSHNGSLKSSDLSISNKPLTIRDEFGLERPLVLQDFFAKSSMNRGTERFLRHRHSKANDSGGHGVIRMPSFISQSLHISTRKKTKVRKAPTLPDTRSDPAPKKKSSPTKRLGMPRFSPIPETIGSSFIKLSASMSPATGGGRSKPRTKGNHMELMTLTRSSPEASVSHSIRKPLHLRTKRRGLTPPTVTSTEGMAGSLAESAGNQSSREIESNSPPLLVTPRDPGLKEDERRKDHTQESESSLSQTVNDDDEHTHTERVVVFTEVGRGDKRTEPAEEREESMLHDRLDSDTMEAIMDNLTGLREEKSERSLQLVIDIDDEDEDDAHLHSVIPLSHVSKTSTLSMDSLGSCVSPKDSLITPHQQQPPMLKDDSSLAPLNGSDTAIIHVPSASQTKLDREETAGSSSKPTNYRLASLSLADLRQASLMKGGPSLPILRNTRSGDSPPSKTRLKVFVELGEVIPLPIKVLGKEFIEKSEVRNTQITKNHYLSPSVSPPNREDDATQPNNHRQFRYLSTANPTYLFTPSLSSGAVSPSVDTRNELSGIVNILLFVLDKFVSMDGLHSINVSNDARKSAMDYHPRLQVISNDERGDPLMQKIAQTLSLEKQVKLILRSLLCLDRVLKEVLKMVKNDTFYRFHQSPSFHRWFQQRNAEFDSD